MGSGYSLIAATQWYVQGSKHYGKQGYMQAASTWKKNDLEVDLTGQVHVVTGANAGLGYATALAAASRRAETHILCRNKERGETARQAIMAATGNREVHLHTVDVADISSVKAWAASWAASGRPIHVLVNNAGVLPATKEYTKDGLESAMATALGQSYLLTGLLLPALVRGGTPSSPSRVINVSSGGGLTVRLCEDLHLKANEGARYDGTLQYAQAKRAQMMLTELWAAKLRAAGAPVVVHCMHPGWAETPGVKSSLADFAKANEGKLRTPEEGADTIVWLAAAKNADINVKSGQFWFDRAAASMHFTLAGTQSSKGGYEKLWETCASDFAWQFDPASLK